MIRARRIEAETVRFHHRRFDAPFGAEIRDPDLSQPIDDATARTQGAL